MIRPLAVSLGDPAGVGPELIAACWAERATLDLPPFAVVGSRSVLEKAGRSRRLDVPTRTIVSLADADEVFGEALPVIELDQKVDVALGRPDPAGARLALASLEEATRLVRTAEASALVTLPIAKGLLAEIGFAYPGQTEFLAARCDQPSENAVMMLAGPQLRAVPITVHCALSQVSDKLNSALIEHKARIVHAALQTDFGIAHPRLAVAGLNPHAGENGRMGREEMDIIAPAIARLRGSGIDATGPYAGDALFTPRARKTYDAAIAMYHDQALIPLKALDFDEGVNVTLGLPIVRTSPDHGTAFDIAGKGKADPGATAAALTMAAQCARRRGA